MNPRAIFVAMPPGLLTALDDACEDRCCTRSAMVRRAIAVYLEGNFGYEPPEQTRLP